MSQSNRLWALGSVGAMIVLLLAGWFVGAQPALTAAALADQERQNVEAQNAAQLLELAQLADLRANQDELDDEYRTLRRSIPSTPGTSAFIDGLDALALKAGVTITGFTVADPLAYTVPASAATAPVTESTESGDPTEVPADPSLTTTAPPMAVTNPLITPDNFVGVLVGIDVVGQYDAVLSFIDGLQTGKRLFLVTAIESDRAADVESAAKNIVAARVSGFIYVLEQN